MGHVPRTKFWSGCGFCRSGWRNPLADFRLPDILVQDLSSSWAGDILSAPPNGHMGHVPRTKFWSGCEVRLRSDKLPDIFAEIFVAQAPCEPANSLETIAKTSGSQGRLTTGPVAYSLGSVEKVLIWPLE
jgi:hypothetical protein